GRLTNMTKDTLRCVEGPNEGKPCMGRTDCPAGQCEDMHVLDCAADARGRAVYFIFDGNPTGQNPDLGDELFVFDTTKAELPQVAGSAGSYCAANTANHGQACASSSDCGAICGDGMKDPTEQCGSASRSARSSPAGPRWRGSKGPCSSAARPRLGARRLSAVVTRTWSCTSWSPAARTASAARAVRR